MCACVCDWATQFTSFDLVLETAAPPKTAYNEDKDDGKIMSDVVMVVVVSYAEKNHPAKEKLKKVAVLADAAQKGGLDLTRCHRRTSGPNTRNTNGT